MSDGPKDRPITREGHAAMPMSGYDEQWIEIQRKTFTNWVNDQLISTGKQVEVLEEDLKSGEILVALIETLQFKKIGKICRKPKNRLQMFQNVSLAFKAITEDNIRLVNVGNEDVVNGNLKLILGLIWRLIIRYHISSSKIKAPPKKIMMQWLRTAIPELTISNLTSDWNDGIALHALLDYCKPGLSPNWRQLHSKNGVENCRSAMALAKDHLNIPRVINAEDFASSNLDELSAMTYLSYFVKKDSPGYYATLNWVCKQIRSTSVTNLTTDWNDGIYLCNVVQSLGGKVTGWPDLDKNDGEENCQKGIDAASALGVKPILTATEMIDPSVDHLGMMAYINSFRNIKPRRSKEDKLQVRCNFTAIKVGEQAVLQLDVMDDECNKENIRIDVNGPGGKQDSEIKWYSNNADVTIVPLAVGKYQIRAFYDDVEVKGGPVEFNVTPDISKVNVSTKLGSNAMVGVAQELTVDTYETGGGRLRVVAKTPGGKTIDLPCREENGRCLVSFIPSESGVWTVSTTLDREPVEGGTFSVNAFDPNTMTLTGPSSGLVDQEKIFEATNSRAELGEITAYVMRGSAVCPCRMETQNNQQTNVRFTPKHGGHHKVHVQLNGVDIKGSPHAIEIQDPSSIYVTGEGVVKCLVGEEAKFTIHPEGKDGDIAVYIEESGKLTKYQRTYHSDGTTDISYRPLTVGMYTVDVRWNDNHVKGSPFLVRITDPTKVVCLEDFTDWLDESDHFLLDYKEETILRFSTIQAGPGKFTAEVLGRSGRVPVKVSNARADVVEVSFTAQEIGDHYIHLYWSEVPLDNSPLIGYCLGPRPPLDHSNVVVKGEGCEQARASVQAQFIIDGRFAGPGLPEVRMEGLKSRIDVYKKRLSCDRYKCTYTADSPGGYLLYVYWSNEQVPDSPFKVTVTMKGDASKVVACGEGLKGGLVGKELRVLIDTNPTGPGEITTSCNGPSQNARCQLFDHRNRTYTLRIFPTEAGRHNLNVMYDKTHIPGSPFAVRVSDPPDASQVKVYGPGIENGVIQRFQSRFIVETRGAGAGQLAVKVRGPKGGFKVEMMRESNEDRTILCRYDPTESGTYVINVKWSGEHVPGSPFDVNVFDSLEALQKDFNEKGNVGNGFAKTGWHEDI